MATDIHSLNSRYFDLSARLPRTLQRLEPQLRQNVQSALARGKINLAVTVTIDDGAEAPLRINRPRLQQYHDLFMQIKAELSLEEGPSFSQYTGLGDVLTTDEVDRDELLEGLLQESLKEALDQASEMRRKEGAHLATDLESRLDNILAEVDSIEKGAADRRAGDLERLRARIGELVADVALDESRLLQEVALLADKRDISEECIRLRSHMELFRGYMQDEERAGKRLGFLLQEMVREVNTIGSKTDDVEITHAVVRAKDQLEKIREQVQNIL